jgi:hypothetical protein
VWEAARDGTTIVDQEDDSLAAKALDTVSNGIRSLVKCLLVGNAGC